MKWRGSVVLTKLEELLQAGAYLGVRKEADRVLLEGNLSIRDQGAVLRLACRARLHLADFYAAAKLGERAIELAREAEDINTLGMAHFDLGVAYTHVGDANNAEQNLNAFLALYPQMTWDDAYEGKAYYNLSVIHRQRKQWYTAIQELEKAAQIFERIGRRNERARCALDAARCYLTLGASSLAAPHLDHVEEYLHATPDDVLSADLICEKALYYRLEGDIATSSQLCQEIFMPGRQGIGSHHLGEAAWIMGENALDIGRMEEAQVFVNMALDHAARCNWPGLMNLGCDLHRRVAARMAVGA
jgi:tetratricopeptide (TPR) repeat protein